MKNTGKKPTPQWRPPRGMVMSRNARPQLGQEQPAHARRDGVPVAPDDVHVIELEEDGAGRVVAHRRTVRLDPTFRLDDLTS
jgi:hypothetical protein